MPDNGVRTIDLTSLASAEDLLAHQDGTLGLVPRDTLALLLAASGAVADRLAELDRATSYASLLRPSWAALAALAPEAIGQQAEVSPDDSGSHTDPQSGLTVDNAGRYTAFGTSSGQWTWVDGGGLGSKLSISGALEELSGAFAGTARTNIGAASQADMDAAEAAIATKAPLDTPHFTGTPNSTTPPEGNNTTRIATTEFVATAVADKAPLDTPHFTGTPNSTTPPEGNNTTRIATTEFVNTAVAPKANTDAVVALTGAQTIADVKEFTDPPVVPDGSFSFAKTSGLPELAQRAEPIVAGVYSDGSLPDGYRFGVWDSGNKVAFAITDDGTTEAAVLRTQRLTIGDDAISREVAQGWGQSVTDSAGNVGTAVSQGGRLSAVNPVFKGSGRRALKSGRRFLADVTMFNNTGQSNAEGTTGLGTAGITQLRARGALGISTAYGLMELTNGWFGKRDSTNGWNTENPTFGTVGFVLELLEKEDGIDWQAHDGWFVGSNNGLGGNTLAQLSEGGTSGKYEAAIAQAGAVRDVAENAGLAPSYGMTTWAQGEAEPTSTTYKADLLALAESYRLDAKAATGQTHDPIFVTWQLCEAIGAANFVSRAQLEAANEDDLIYCSGPTYHLPRLDGTHFTPIGMKWLGAYFGLVYKRVVIDGQDWSPLQPVHHTVIGNAIDLHFNKRGLAFDTTGDLPLQPDYGFAVTQADGTTAVTISSVEIVGPDRVRVTCASAPQPGWRVKYGHSAMTGITAWTYTGPGGNLRDNAGAHLTYDEISKPMHNWCSIFNYEV